jgi:LacI family transcriptional regulator
MSRNVDGIILFYIGDEYNIDQLNKLYQTGIPVVLIDRYVPSIELDYVVTNNYKAAYSVVENLINSGFRNIYHFNHPLTTTSLVERKQGYLDAMNASSLDPTLILSNCKPKNEGWSHDGEKNVNEHYFQLVCDTLEFAESPFAFFFADSNFYLKTIKAIKLMKTPPVRYALACFDDPGLYFAPNCEMIIHVDQPLSEIGKRSVNIIIDKINGINIKRQEHLSPQIIVNRVEKIPV